MSVESLFETLAAFSVDPLFLWLVVFFITFVLEEGAAAFAVVLALSDHLSLPLATTAVYFGVVTTDVGLYGLGYTARRFKWASRWVDPAKVKRAADWMGPRLLPTVIMSRLLPWMLPPTFIACGFLRLPFKQFFWFASSTGAVWTAVVFGTLLGFGNILLQHRVSWTSGCAIVGLIAVIVWKLRAVIARRPAPANPAFYGADSVLVTRDEHFLSLPERRATRLVCWFERLPAWLFYAPVALMWLMLSLRYRSFTLPTAANPSFECGGLVGESKNQAMLQVSPAAATWFAPQVLLTRSLLSHGSAEDLQTALRALETAELTFPMVAKPDRGHQGHGVQPIHCVAELLNYIDAFPRGESIVLQKLITLQQEAGVFYVRLPGERLGHIFSMNLSAPAQVVGNGVSSLRQLIHASPLVARCRALQLAAQHDRLDSIPGAREVVVLAFARSLRLGATLSDGRQFVTPALLARFDEIADGINDFCFGRFDVRFDRLDEFQKGQNFQIVEVNGVGAEANHIWDANTTLRNAYKTLFAQYKLAFHIGHLNRQRGCQPVGIRMLWRFFINQHRVLKLLHTRSSAG
ncbi:MAG: VTT domain-containing protein [Rhizobacter sp.]|nr:VTT domain-containing protein [Burkholderiales bacterium]